MKQTLVRFGNDYKKINTENIKFVGGDEGVFATYQDGNLIYFLGGDDGAWWVMASYHQDWCEDISKNIAKVSGPEAALSPEGRARLPGCAPAHNGE